MWGKELCRKPIRSKTGKELKTKSVGIYRAEKANEFMNRGNV